MSADDNPFRSLERQFERMQRQFEEALDMSSMDQFSSSSTGVSTMGIDLVDHGEAFELTADVPGFEKDDVEVRLTDTTIHVTAEREEEETEEDEDLYLKSERARKSLSRSIRLPEPVDESEVEATYRNGVLTVTLPKREPADPEGQTIDIK